MYEHHQQPLLSQSAFAGRLVRSTSAFAFLITASLAVGTLGYHALAGLSWVDAFLNASMILTGMGPVSPLPSALAKIFASLYALFSGVIFLVACGLGVAPIVHRFLHRFHLDLEEGSNVSDTEQ